MTLTTHFAITNRPCNARDLHMVVTRFVGGDNDTDMQDYETTKYPDETPVRLIRNRVDQGLNALVWTEGAIEKPFKIVTNWNDDDEPVGWFIAFAEMAFDTPYGYNPTKLHSEIIEHLAAWCAENGYEYAWQNEFTGEWFTDLSGLPGLLAS